MIPLLFDLPSVGAMMIPEAVAAAVLLVSVKVWRSIRAIGREVHATAEAAREAKADPAVVAALSSAITAGQMKIAADSAAETAQLRKDRAEAIADAHAQKDKQAALAREVERLTAKLNPAAPPKMHLTIARHLSKPVETIIVPQNIEDLEPVKAAFDRSPYRCAIAKHDEGFRCVAVAGDGPQTPAIIAILISAFPAATLQLSQGIRENLENHVGPNSVVVPLSRLEEVQRASRRSLEASDARAAEALAEAKKIEEQREAWRKHATDAKSELERLRSDSESRRVNNDRLTQTLHQRNDKIGEMVKAHAEARDWIRTLERCLLNFARTRHALRDDLLTLTERVKGRNHALTVLPRTTPDELARVVAIALTPIERDDLGAIGVSGELSPADLALAENIAKRVLPPGADTPLCGDRKVGFYPGVCNQKSGHSGPHAETRTFPNGNVEQTIWPSRWQLTEADAETPSPSPS